MADKPEWKDATSYSRGERGKIAPTSWELTINGVRVFVTRSHRYNPGNWAFTCHEVGADAKTICKDDAHPKSAQEVALKYVAAQLRKKSDRLRLTSDAMFDMAGS